METISAWIEDEKDRLWKSKALRDRFGMKKGALVEKLNTKSKLSCLEL